MYAGPAGAFGKRAARARLALSRPHTGGGLDSEMSFLEVRFGSATVLEDYERGMTSFMDWAQGLGALHAATEPAPQALANISSETRLTTMIGAQSNEAIDSTLIFYFDRAFFEPPPPPPAFGEKLYASIVFFAPRFACLGCGALPRALRALRGWRMLVPPVTQVSLPWLGLRAILSLEVQTPRIAAVAYLTGFDCCLRPVAHWPPDRRSLRPSHEDDQSRVDSGRRQTRNCPPPSRGLFEEHRRRN